MEKNSSFGKNGIIVLVLTTLSSAINYLSQIMMGRFLDVSSYGIINSVFSIMLITGVIGTTLGMIASKVVAENLALGEWKGNQKSINAIAGWLALGCIIVLIGGVILVFLLNDYFSRYSIGVITCVLLTIVTSLIPPVFQGILGGLQEFLFLGLYTLIIPIVKILGCVCLKIYGYVRYDGICVVLTSIIIGNILAMILGVGLIRRKHMKLSVADMVQELKQWKIEKVYWDSFVVNILMMILMNADVLYLKTFVGADAAGLYSSGLMFGRVIYYCATALVSVLLPMVALNKVEDEKKSLVMLNKTLFFTFVLIIFFLVPMNIFSEKLLGFIFGNKYLLAVKYIKYASFISVSTSLNMILMNYMVGVEKTSFFKKTLSCGCVIFASVLLLVSNKEYTTLFLLGCTGLLIFVVNYLYCIKDKRKGTKDENK